MALIDTEGIMLRSFKLAEADKIVICLTRKFGLIRGVARGARKLKSKFGASLEPFTHINVSYFEKEGRELVSIRHTEILSSYFDLAGDAETVAALEYMSELAIEFAPPHQADEKLFRMVKACIDAIAADPANLAAVVRYYEIWMLKLAGFFPDPRVCGRCNITLKAGRTKVFISADARLLCGECAGAGGASLDSKTHEHLLAARILSPGNWARHVDALHAQTEKALATLTRRMIELSLERKPRGQAPQMPAQSETARTKG